MIKCTFDLALNGTEIGRHGLPVRSASLTKESTLNYIPPVGTTFHFNWDPYGQDKHNCCDCITAELVEIYFTPAGPELVISEERTVQRDFDEYVKSLRESGWD